MSLAASSAASIFLLLFIPNDEHVGSVRCHSIVVNRYSLKVAFCKVSQALCHPLMILSNVLDVKKLFDL